MNSFTSPSVRISRSSSFSMLMFTVSSMERTISSRVSESTPKSSMRRVDSGTVARLRAFSGARCRSMIP